MFGLIRESRLNQEIDYNAHFLMPCRRWPKILFIAGLDPSGNAGLLRDLEIAGRFPLRLSAIATALTSQNCDSFFSANVVMRSVLKAQWRSVAPLEPLRAVKIGMLGDETVVETLANLFGRMKKKPKIVLDPVCESTTGGILLTRKGREALWKRLVSMAAIWTPNMAEASFFSGIQIDSRASMEKAGLILWNAKKVPVLVKGYHHDRLVEDLFVDSGRKMRLTFPELKLEKPRGTGCALSTFIACRLALGFPVADAVKKGRKDLADWMKTALA